MAIRSTATLLARMTILTATAFVTQSTAQSSAQAAQPPCASPQFRRFDFWVGTWNVTDAAGKSVGRNEITREELDCVIVERWRSASGGTGLSMNYYDPQTQRWTQHWVGLGLLLTMTGGLENDAMVLEGPMQNLREHRVTTLRGIWTRLDDGRVRQRFLESTDGGKTWTQWFDGYYERAGS